MSELEKDFEPFRGGTWPDFESFRGGTWPDFELLKGGYGRLRVLQGGRASPDFEPFKAGLDAYVVHWSTRSRQVKPKGLAPEEFRSQSLVA